MRAGPRPREECIEAGDKALDDAEACYGGGHGAEGGGGEGGGGEVAQGDLWKRGGLVKNEWREEEDGYYWGHDEAVFEDVCSVGDGNKKIGLKSFIWEMRRTRRQVRCICIISITK